MNQRQARQKLVRPASVSVLSQSVHSGSVPLPQSAEAPEENLTHGTLARGHVCGYNEDMTITARYPGTCPCCSGSITPGQSVEWTKGSAARHTNCAQGIQAAPANTSAPRIQTRRTSRPGCWTGCSCGSREDSSGQLIASTRNCASCRFDAE